jgi:hypothetical protein
MQRVYRLLREAREQGIIPWEWIVDETRGIERVSTWSNPAEYAECVAKSYRRDFWDQQRHRVQVWSEKGTVRGLLAPVLDEYAVGPVRRQMAPEPHQYTRVGGFVLTSIPSGQAHGRSATTKLNYLDGRRIACMGRMGRMTFPSIKFVSNYSVRGG